MTTSSSATFAAHIPNITALRDSLQYGNARLPRCGAFNDTLTVFRKNYMTSTSLRGSEIHDWNSAEHQAALTEMSQAFLDRDGNGELYWPTDPTSPNFNTLQYTSEQPFIRQAIKQLIYRLNLQQYRNARYKRRGPLRNDDRSNLQHAYASIEISSDEASTISPLDATAARMNAPEVQPAQHDQYGTIMSASRSAGAVTNSLPTAPVYDGEDSTFTIPDSPQFISLDKTQIPKRRLRGGGSSQLPKRPKPSLPRKPFKRVGAHKDGGSSFTAVKWTSPRGTRTIPRPERAPSDELDSAIASPTHTSTSRTIRQTPEDLINYIRNNRPSITSETGIAVEQSNAPHISGKEPPIDPALEQLVAACNTRVSRGRDEIGSNSSRNAQVTIEAKSNNTPLSTSPMPLLQTFQDSKEKTTVGANTPSAPSPVPKFNSATANIHKPIVEFTYRIILARKPIYHYEKWKLQGNFQDKSLAELHVELPIEKDYEALIIRLQGPGIIVEETIKRDREEEFKAAKRQFNKVVRSLALNQARTKPGETLSIGLEIEPLRSADGVEEDDDEAELEDFTW